MKHWIRSILVLGLALAVTPAWGLSKESKKKIKNMLDEGKLYMRMDAPCAPGRHPYGTYKRPLVEVSPEGSNTDTDTALTASWWHADSTYWGIRVNDAVVLDEVDIEEDDGEVEIELEGIGDAEDNATVIKFVQIYEFEDFQKAFDHTFSRQPLQEGHDDWSQEMKDAIAERRLLEGMNKRQAFYVTGTPESFEKKTENGVEVEIWQLRQDKGMKMGYFRAKAGEKTGLPASVRFEDGKLKNSVESGDSSSFSLD
jgi:hypothetical protein